MCGKVLKVIVYKTNTLYENIDLIRKCYCAYKKSNEFIMREIRWCVYWVRIAQYTGSQENVYAWIEKLRGEI